MGRLRLLFLLALCGLDSAVCLAQSSDLNGHWALEPNTAKVSQADLVGGLTDEVLRAQAELDAYAIRWCNAVGMPSMMAGDLDIRVSRRLMIVSSQAYSYPRYVYFDLPARDPEILDPASVGYSDGRWEGDMLIVDSYGFAGFNYAAPDDYEVRGITSIPGGGFRTPSSRLTERFMLTDDGQTLIVEATWSDPTVYRSAHTYTYRYQRREPSYEPPVELYCDPFDPERTEFLTSDRASN